MEGGCTGTGRLNGALSLLAPTRLLVVEDSASDQRLMRELLVECGVPADSIRCVNTLADAREALVGCAADCILLDLTLPDASGLEAVAIMAAAAPEIPIVVVSGQPQDSLVYQAMANGADEYVCKTDLSASRLLDVLRRAAGRRRGIARLSVTEAEDGVTFESVEVPAVVLDGTGRILLVNQAWQRAATDRDADPAATGVGVDYLKVCERAVGRCSEGAQQAADGIRAVLAGRTEQFTMDYPCHGGEEVEWSTVRVTPLGRHGGGAVVTHSDVTRLKSAELAFRSSDESISLTEEQSAVFALADEGGMLTYVSDSTTHLLGLRENDLLGSKVFERIDARDREGAWNALRRIMAKPGARASCTIRITDFSGRLREFDLVMSNQLDNPAIAAVSMAGSDVTESRQLQIANRLESRLLEQLPAAVVVTDDRGVIAYWNAAAGDLYGYTKDEALGRALSALWGSLDLRGAQPSMDAVAATGRWDGDFDARRADGSLVPVRATVERLDDDVIGFRGFMTTSIDIRDRRVLEQQVAYQALHDSLTGLPNRRLFADHVEHALSRSIREGRRVAAILIDLDDFQLVNDRLGHQGGDQVLRSVAELITGQLRTGDVAGRLGGDEFAVCCDAIESPAEAYALAERIGKIFSAPGVLHSERVNITASIGVALSGPGSGAEAMIRNADVAMYTAKESGKARVELFDDAQHEEARRKLKRASELRMALDLGEVVTYFQPQVMLSNGEVAGFEALIRWNHPEHGLISPDAFIPLAEEFDLIRRLGRLVLLDSCRTLAGWLDSRPHRTLKMAVNVSPLQLSDPGFPGTVNEVIETTGIPPDCLCLEVTESALVDDEVAAVALSKLKALGVEIAIDDFGKGYSSLHRLHQFPLDYLKIDRDFVKEVDESHPDSVMVRAVLGIAHSLGLLTVAEGIENAAQLELVASAGCDLGQGYFWSAALSVDEATLLLGQATCLTGSDFHVAPETEVPPPERPSSASHLTLIA